MSWHFEFIADSKTTAKQKITALQSKSGGHIPPSVAAAIVTLIDGVGDHPDYRAVKVKSSGHLVPEGQPSTGNATIEVSAAQLVDERNATT